MSKPAILLMVGNNSLNVGLLVSRQKNSVLKAVAPLLNASLIRSRYVGVLTPMMKGLSLNVAPPAPALAMRSMASSLACGLSTPRSITRAFSASLVMIENLKFQFFCPLIKSMYLSSLVNHAPLVEKQSG